MNKKSKSKTKADTLISLFDDDWKNTQRSKIRTKLYDDRSYDPSYSWDARSDNPEYFSRLQATGMPTQLTRPITLSNNAVIQLEDERGLEALNTFNNINKTLSSIPLTSYQNDLGMSNSINYYLPIVDKANNNNQVVVAKSNLGFRNMTLKPPEFTTVDVPKELIESGPQCDQRLLSPQQRLNILNYEKQKYIADHYIQESNKSYNKLRKQLNGLPYHRGLVGLDSTINESSIIYGNKAKEYKNKQEKINNFHDKRNNNLALHTSSMSTNGNILIPESINSNVKINKFYQSKGNKYTTLPFQQTFERLFYQEDIKSDIIPNRQIILRNNEKRYHNYNIVTHSLDTTYNNILNNSIKNNLQLPLFETNKVLDHPSQTSLEGPRNLQGSLRPY